LAVLKPLTPPFHVYRTKMADAGGLSGTEVKLVSSDDKDYSVPVEIASMSVTVKNMLDGM
jgi:hypothetical protein